MEKSSTLPFGLGSGAFIWQILFFYIPLFLLILSSVMSLSGEGYFAGLTLSHFSAVLSPVYFKIIGNSLGIATLTAGISLIIAYPLAHYMAFYAKKIKSLLLFMLIVPFWTNFLLHIYAWFFVLERQGFLNNLLLNLGITSEPLHLLNSPFATMLMMVYYYLPFMVLPIYASLERFDSKLIEASLDLGATPQQTFRSIMLPLSLPAIRTGFFLVFIPAFGEFVIPELMGGDRIYFVGNVISQYILGEHTEGMGAAFTVVSSIILLLFSGGFYILFKKINKTIVRLR
ncbi:MAG: ABC transporter permease [Candidatus Algichlamydia australiensis]|nr:ABC transporter permease [Chlamydiales bacterium]